jgi:hypothetical protein
MVVNLSFLDRLRINIREYYEVCMGKNDGSVKVKAISEIYKVSHNLCRISRLNHLTTDCYS